MKQKPSQEAEKYRITQGPMRSDSSFGNNGCFLLPGLHGAELFVIVSDGLGWEHVSVSLASKKPRCPTWEEMCYVKTMFWDDEETVIQFHPAKSNYVNNHPYVLHLWRSELEGTILLPPTKLIGIK